MNLTSISAAGPNASAPFPSNVMLPPTSATGTAPATGSGAQTSTDPLASESTFLTLLVSQLQNQDPLSPVDSNQFVTQLTQYSQLEQLIGIHKDTTNLDQAATSTSGTSGNAGTGAAN
jgi:flagellar basal-body rod modification protein FlgD